MSRALLSIAVLAVTAGVAAAAPAPIAEWTFMVYMDADCDLEATTLPDLEEMVAVGSSPQVRVVVLADRAERGGDEDGFSDDSVANLRNWTTAKLLAVEDGRLREIADWGEVNMADGATLARFVRTVQRDFPARRYALVVGDHGSAWPGIVADDSSPQEGDMLTMDELHAALAPVLAERPLELIGFDACLMANYETALSVAPLARTMVASEELEPGSGWQYTATLRALVQTPTLTGAALGRIVADSYLASFVRSSDEDVRSAGLGVTLSVLDLARLAALETAVDRLGNALAADITQRGRASWLQIAEARASSEDYGTLGDPDAPDSGLYDLRDFAFQVQEHVTTPAVRAAAAEAARAVDVAVVHRVRGGARPSANGLSIFLPPDGESLGPATYAGASAARRGRWLPFIKAYTSGADADEEAPGVDDVAANGADVSVDKPIELSTKVRADDVDEAYFVLSEVQGEESYIIGKVLIEPDEDGKLEEEWDGDWFTIGTANRRVVCPVTDMEPVAEEEEDAQEEDVPGEFVAKAGFADYGGGAATGSVTGTAAVTDASSDESVYLVEVPVEVSRRGSSVWRDVLLYFHVDFDEDDIKGAFVYAFLDTDDGPREYELRPGDRIRPVYIRVTDEGEDLVVSEEPEDVITLARGAADLTVQMGRVEVGEYRVGFEVLDYAENVTEHMVDVTVR